MTRRPECTFAAAMAIVQRRRDDAERTRDSHHDAAYTYDWDHWNARLIELTTLERELRDLESTVTGA